MQACATEVHFKRRYFHSFNEKRNGPVDRFHLIGGFFQGHQRGRTFGQHRAGLLAAAPRVFGRHAGSAARASSRKASHHQSCVCEMFFPSTLSPKTGEVWGGWARRRTHQVRALDGDSRHVSFVGVRVNGPPPFGSSERVRRPSLNNGFAQLLYLFAATRDQSISTCAASR